VLRPRTDGERRRRQALFERSQAQTDSASQIGATAFRVAAVPPYVQHRAANGPHVAKHAPSTRRPASRTKSPRLGSSSGLLLGRWCLRLAYSWVPALRPCLDHRSEGCASDLPPTRTEARSSPSLSRFLACLFACSLFDRHCSWPTSHRNSKGISLPRIGSARYGVARRSYRRLKHFGSNMPLSV
jgi:hypothetical protein